MELLEYVVLVVAGTLPIANPFGAAPLFVSLTATMKPADQIAQANRACIYMAVILIGTFFLGSLVLEFFGITIPAVRLAGGLVILYIGFGMLFPRIQDSADEIAANASQQKDFAFTPLAMPMLSGPGSIAVVLEMSARIAEVSQVSHRALGAVVVTIGILITVLICWIVLRGAQRFVQRLGPARIDAMTKMLGFLLICIGVEFAAGGFRSLVH
ncbi:MAG: MarC family NAAT transporter [Alphaproteobacteria bacterium]|nr:MarC family NAAT transporter [Alphaproteobacteria bacterium]